MPLSLPARLRSYRKESSVGEDQRNVSRFLGTNRSMFSPHWSTRRAKLNVREGMTISADQPSAVLAVRCTKPVSRSFSYQFFRRFGVSEESLGILFFVVRLLNALSHLGAAWLARRIGLVKTMVFTHLPSSLFLLAVPFAPSFKVAVLLLLCREALVEMDVPTRQSYVAAVVQPSERTFASGITNLARNVFWAIGSALAGVLMQNVAFYAPLVIGSGSKISY